MPIVEATNPALTANRDCSFAKIAACATVAPRPPYSTGHTIPAQPPSANSRCHHRPASKCSRSSRASSSRARITGT